MDNFWRLFENLDEIVYVTDGKNHELIYMNKKALETFGFDSLERAAKEKCYQILRNSAAPCAFCGSQELKPGSFRQRRYFDPQMNRHFLLRDTLWEENGRQYRLVMALDVSLQEQQGHRALL